MRFAAVYSLLSPGAKKKFMPGNMATPNCHQLMIDPSLLHPDFISCTAMDKILVSISRQYSRFSEAYIRSYI